MPINDLKYYIRTYEHSLDGALCRRMVSLFNSLERLQQRNGREVRAGLNESAWTEINVGKFADDAFIAMVRNLVDAALAQYNRDIGLTMPIPNSGLFSGMVMKRYRPNAQEQFQLHFDAVNRYAKRYLVLLWYLNDVAGGGETRFPQLDLAIAPREGRLLIFPPYWMYQHEGAPPISGEKYILSTYLLFDDSDPS